MIPDCDGVLTMLRAGLWIRPAKREASSMAEIDKLIINVSSSGLVSACTLCGHRETRKWLRDASEHNRREGGQARTRMVRHIKEKHSDAYAEALERDRAHRAHRSAERVRDRERRARMTPYELGCEAAIAHSGAVERYSARSPDTCPFAKGTDEEKEYDRGWKSATSR
jgi:hypothetical protein